MELLEDLNRDYQRYRFTPRERSFLALQGLQPVLSSNVAAVGVRDTELLIRFHNGSVYSYRNKADQYENILKSNSKGKWVWRNLRRKNAPYEKIGVIPLPDDIGVSDEDIFQEIDNRYLADLTRHVDVPVFQSFTFINGINTQKIVIGNVVAYKPITNVLPLAPEQPIAVEPSKTIEIRKPLDFESKDTVSKAFDVFSEKVGNSKTPYNNVKNVLAKANNIFSNGSPITVKLSTQGGMAIKPNRRKPQITVPKLTDKKSLYGVETFTHEYSHMVDFKFMDYLGQKDGKDFSSNISFSSLGLRESRPKTDFLGQAYDISKQLTDSLREQIKQAGKDKSGYMDNRTQGIKDIIETLQKNQAEIINEMNNNIDKIQNDYNNGKISYEQATKKRDEVVTESTRKSNTSFYSEAGVVDIYDAITGGYMKSDKKIAGHGVMYYQVDAFAIENRLNEIYANLNQISIDKPEYIETLRQDIPEIIESWENMNNFIDEVVDESI